MLKLRLPEDGHARHAELAERSNVGAITPAERVELEDLLQASELLMLLHAKARTTLKRTTPQPEAAAADPRAD